MKYTIKKLTKMNSVRLENLWDKLNFEGGVVNQFRNTLIDIEAILEKRRVLVR